MLHDDDVPEKVPPEVEKLPAGQLLHEPEPASEYFPAAQFVHVPIAVAVKAVLAVPATQLVH